MQAGHRIPAQRLAKPPLPEGGRAGTGLPGRPFPCKLCAIAAAAALGCEPIQSWGTAKVKFCVSNGPVLRVSGEGEARDRSDKGEAMASLPATATAEARKIAGSWLHPSNRIAAYSSGESRDQRGAVKG
jgi:hypothetical protein